MIGVRYFGIGHSGNESYGGAMIEWQPIIDSLSQSVIVLATIITTMDNRCNISFTNFNLAILLYSSGILQYFWQKYKLLIHN